MTMQDELDASVRRLRDDGKGRDRIADELGISRSRVWDSLNRLAGEDRARASTQVAVREQEPAAVEAISAARAALDRAETLDEIKQVIDGTAVGLEAIKRLHRPVEVLIEWAEVKLDAERAAGKYLLTIERTPPQVSGRSAQSGGPMHTAYETTLSEVNVPGAAARRWQVLARLPDELYEKVKAQARDAGKPVSQSSALKAAQAYLEPQQAPRRQESPVTTENWPTGLKLHEGEKWIVPADTMVDPADEDQLAYRTTTHVSGGFPVVAATLRRIGWLDQKGRVWLKCPPSTGFDGGSLTPLLIDARD